MTGRLEGKHAFVTAAGQGIGRAIAVAFAREGCAVTATDIDPRALETLASLQGILTAVLDVRSAAVPTMLATQPRIDILVNCAGFVHQGTILECSDQAWETTFDLNVTAMFRVCRAALPIMMSHGGGSIINIASVASSIRGLPQRFAYGTTKAAVIGLTKSIAADFVGRGIRCNAICPGTVDTPSLRQRIDMAEDKEAARKSFVARQPLGRLGQPEEVAALAVYLGSDEAAFTTGALHLVDGGLCI